MDHQSFVQQVFFLYIKNLHVKQKIQSPGIYLIDIPRSKKKMSEVYNIN